MYMCYFYFIFLFLYAFITYLIHLICLLHFSIVDCKYSVINKCNILGSNLVKLFFYLTRIFYKLKKMKSNFQLKT